VITLQSYLKPDQLELLKESCERAVLEQQQEIMNRLNVQLADDPVSSFVWFHELVAHFLCLHFCTLLLLHSEPLENVAAYF